MLIPSDTSQERHSALTQKTGFANQPRDFDWLAKNIPCQDSCPAGTDIPEYLAAISKGEFEQAYRINLVDNVFPAVLGRVCSRPCELVCRHGWEGLGEPVAICFSKRSASEFMTRNPIVLDPLFQPSGKTVAIIGSGVAGLAAARNLALYGHKVTVYERHSYPGGMLNQGIPEFRLPRDIIDKEIKQVELCGVKINCNTEIGRDLTISQLLENYDAVAIAAGTMDPNILELPGKDLEGIQHGLDFLLKVNEQGTSEIQGDLVVIGGGFTAMDCARTALRLGTRSVKIFYRRSRGEMLVTEDELIELEREKIPIEYRLAPKSYHSHNNLKVTSVKFIRTKLGDPDASGRRRPIEIPNSAFREDASTILLATGQFPETSWIDKTTLSKIMNRERQLFHGMSVSTPVENLFIAGDFALGASTLIDAIGHAKRCAREIDTYLNGKERLTDIALIKDAITTGRKPEANSISRHAMPSIPLEERTLTAEVETGFSKKTSKEEALRCYLCHYKYEIDNDLCIYCDGCLRVMPVENCIVKVSALEFDDDDKIIGYRRSTNSLDYNLLYIDQNECIRCGACVDICPVDCITLQKVSKKTVPVEEVYSTY